MFVLRDADAGAGAPASTSRRAAAARAPGAGIEIVLDLSRLLSRIHHSTPTGIDRVEMSYAHALLARMPDTLLFGAVHPSGFYGRLPAAEVLRFLDLTERCWEHAGVYESPTARRRRALHCLYRLRPRSVAPSQRRRVVLQASHHHLHRPALVAAKLKRENARFVCLLHDLIPISHPEYARPGGAELHRARIRTLQRHAAGLLVNSRATLEVFARQVAEEFAGRPIRVAHPGVDHASMGPAVPTANDRPYFVSIGTIEPRKNHLLLLNIWRSMIEALGPERVPRLYLVGRRGWEIENVVDMLDRCTLLRDCVVELDRLPDCELWPLLRGARALLMPSFAEGYGMPVAEGLTAGVPVLASDLPAHREAGGSVPEYLDPIDGAAWRDAVLAYSAHCSPRRTRQLERLALWQPQCWDRHIDVALALIEDVCA